MAFQVPRSLLTVDTSEPLPLYTPRRYSATDLETSSVHSSAPSYVSAAPSYHSSVPASHRRVTENTPPSNTTQPARDRPHLSSSATDSRVTRSTGQGLRPAPPYAAGYGNRVTAGSSSNNLSNPNSIRSLYNVAEWVPVTEGLQSRHYQNVARRRVSEALNGNTSAARSMFPSLFPTLSESDTGSSERTSPSSGSGFASSSTNLVENPSGNGINRPRSNSPGAILGNALALDEQLLPLSPHEDPDLVGEEAAARFRSQRLYRVYQQLENQEQLLQSTSAPEPSRPRTNSQPARPYNYSPLIPPANSSTAATSRNVPGEFWTRNTTSPTSSPNPSSSNVHLPQTNSVARYATHPLRQRANTTADFEEALRDQESRTWDFMIAQMASWEERQRDWKKFKEDVDRRMGSKMGLSWVHWQGTKKLKKGQENQKRPKKWKSKVGLAA